MSANLNARKVIMVMAKCVTKIAPLASQILVRPALNRQPMVAAQDGLIGGMDVAATVNGGERSATLNARKASTPPVAASARPIAPLA